MKPIDIHIDELVLHGLAEADGHGVGGALQQELARLLAERGVPTVTGAKSPQTTMDTTNAETTGAQVAKAVYGVIGK